MKRKKGVVEPAQRDENTVHFVFFTDSCHLQNSEFAKKYQTFKGRVVFRGDAAKDDSGSCAVFTEQRSSASHMTAATVLDVVSRLLDCVGESSDAVSACDQVKMEHAPVSLRLPTSECPAISMSTTKNFICENVQWHRVVQKSERIKLHPKTASFAQEFAHGRWSFSDLVTKVVRDQRT